MPQEIEDSLLAALPIREICVVTVADHEDVHHAVVVIVPKNTKDNDEISKSCQG